MIDNGFHSIFHTDLVTVYTLEYICAVETVADVV